MPKPKTITRLVEEAAPPKIPPVALAVEDAAEALHIGQNTMRKLLDDGQIKGIQIGRCWIVPVAELHSFVAAFAGKKLDAA